MKQLTHNQQSVGSSPAPTIQFMKPNLNNDLFFLLLVTRGILKVDHTGLVLNVKTSRYLGSNTKQGYFKLSYLNPETGRIQHIQLHRLIYLVWGGPLTEGQIVNHRDGDKKNNDISNLEPSTNSENNEHAFRLGLRNPKLGSTNPQAKLSEQLVTLIRKLHKAGRSMRSLAKEHGVAITTIRPLLKRETWKHVT